MGGGGGGHSVDLCVLATHKYLKPCSKVIQLFFSHSAVVNVSFSESMYNVTEGEEFVEVCIDISGQRERNVTAMIETLNGTALGMTQISL